jgi:hypothetical protein
LLKPSMVAAAPMRLVVAAPLVPSTVAAALVPLMLKAALVLLAVAALEVSWVVTSCTLLRLPAVAFAFFVQEHEGVYAP